METNVLLSIKPEFAKAIFDGVKKFEFRKAIFKNRNVDKVYVYASAPVSQVIGYFTIDKILESHPEDLWEETKHSSGIKKNYYDEYFEGRERAYAIRVHQTQLFETPVTLQERFKISHPPQSFRYVH